MKLDTSGWEFAVAQGHDMTFRCTGADFQTIRNRTDQEGVVPANDEWVYDGVEHAFAVMMNRPAFSMTGISRFHGTAQFQGQALHAQTYAEKWRSTQKPSNGFSGEWRFRRVTGPR